MRRMRMIGALTVALALVVGTTPGGAHADPSADAGSKNIVSSARSVLEQTPVPAGFTSWAAVMQMQQRLNAAATRIQAAAKRQANSGYAGAVAAPENRALVIYWKGPLPSAVQRVVAEQSRGVPVKVVSARYSLAQMLAEGRKLASDAAYAEVVPLFDGSGIRVKGVAGKTPRARAATSRVAVVQAGAASSPGVLFSRTNDYSPYWGGARTGGCTTGFAVWWGGYSRLLTAGHCGNNGNNVYDGGGDYMGQIFNDNDTRDTQMINARGAARVWDGPWTETSFTKAVRGASFSNIGNWLCTSGSRSGVRCNIRVIANNSWWGSRFPMVYADQQAHVSGAGQGDSGGPVFELPYPDDGKVIAKGTITGGVSGTFVACTGEVWAGRLCSWRFVYADVTQALSYYGASIMVS